MKNFSIVPLYPFEVKLVAVIGAIVTLSLWLLSAYNVIGLPVSWLEIILLSLMVVAIFSKEKHEDSKIQKLRYTAFKISLLTFFTISVGFNFTKLISGDALVVDLLLVAYLIAGVYLTSFYMLYLARYKDIFEESLNKSISLNPIFYIFYTAFVLASFLYILTKYIIL